MASTLAEMTGGPLRILELSGGRKVAIYGISMADRERLAAMERPMPEHPTAEDLRVQTDVLIERIFLALSPGMPELKRDEMRKIDWLNGVGREILDAVNEVVGGEPFRGGQAGTATGGKRRRGRLGGRGRDAGAGVRDSPLGGPQTHANADPRPE